MPPTTEKKIGEIIMSKLKKKAFTIILSSMLCIMSCLPVFAAEPGISPHVEATECFECGARDLYTHRAVTGSHLEYFPNGVSYMVYEITVTDHCNSCGYTHEYKYTTHDPL